MARGDLSRIALRKRREVTYGVFDAGSMRTLNIATEALKGATTIKRSAVGKSNRLPGPRRKVAVSGAGNVVVDLTYGVQMDEFLEEAFCSTFTTALAISSSAISFAAADNSINGTALFAAVVAGTWIRVKVTGATPSGWTSQYVFVVSKPSNDKLIVAYQTLANLAAGPTITIVGSHLRNGTTLLSSTYERDNADLTTDRYQAYRGQVVSSMELRFNFEEIIQATFNLTGLGPDAVSSTSIASPAVAVAAESMATIMDVSNNMRAFRSNGSLDGNIKSLTLTLNNNSEYIKLAQQLNPDGISLGVAALSGTLEGYLVDTSARRDLAYDDDPDNLHWFTTDDAGDTYVWTIFRAFYSDMGDVPKSGNQGPVPFALAFEADEDTVYADTWIQCCKFAA